MFNVFKNEMPLGRNHLGVPICKSVELRPGELTQVVFIYKKPLCNVSDFFLNISMNAPHFCFQWGLQWGNSQKWVFGHFMSWEHVRVV